MIYKLKRVTKQLPPLESEKTSTVAVAMKWIQIILLFTGIIVKPEPAADYLPKSKTTLKAKKVDIFMSSYS